MSQTPSGPPRSADEALARVDADISSAADRARAATAFRQSLEALRGHGRARGVTVTVDSAGGLHDLELPRSFDERTAAELRDDILAAVRVAQQDVVDAIRSRTRTTFGAGSAVAERVDAELAARFDRS